MMKRLIIPLVVFALTLTASASVTTIGPDSYQFELDQFSGATVSYRSKADGGSVGFDGKLWDNIAGVDGVTIGELAAGQYGSDPGDQLSLNDYEGTVDWFQLNYGNAVTLTDSLHTFVVYEIATPAYLDPEGTNFNISFNGNVFNPATGATDASNFNIGSGAENINQIVFDLFDYGFQVGDMLSTVKIENADCGISGARDPDFIFAGVAGTQAVVPVPGALLLGGLGIGLVGFFRRK